jgi:hypothetical protein
VDFVAARLKLGNQAVGVPLRPAAGREEVAFNDADTHVNKNASSTVRTLYGNRAVIAIAQGSLPPILWSQY